VMSSAAGLWKLFRDQAERGSGIGLKLFGFIAESVFTIIPESCSGSSRKGVRNHPGIAFTLDRIPHSTPRSEYARSGAHISDLDSRFKAPLMRSVQHQVIDRRNSNGCCEDGPPRSTYL